MWPINRDILCVCWGEGCRDYVLPCVLYGAEHVARGLMVKNKNPIACFIGSELQPAVVPLVLGWV